MHKITLDPATTFGYCLYLDKEELPERADGTPYMTSELLFYGQWDLTKDEAGKKCSRRGQYAWNLWAAFNSLCRLHGIEGQDIEIILEGESYGSQKSEAGRRMAAAWLHTLEMMCERKRLEYPRTCPPDSWRGYFIDCTKAPKEVGLGMPDKERYAARRAWLKNAVLAECARRGLNPKSDNEADALGMMFWLMQGGKEEQERKRADKKAKALAKRRQAALPLQVAA